MRSKLLSGRSNGAASIAGLISPVFGTRRKRLRSAAGRSVIRIWWLKSPLKRWRRKTPATGQAAQPQANGIAGCSSSVLKQYSRRARSRKGKKMSRVHGTIQRPVCMRTFALRPDAPDEPSVARHRGFSAMRRVTATNASSADSASCRSRNLDTAFRSLTTTLSPPLRGQCSWPAPSFPHRRPSRTRSILELFRSVRFRGRTGATSTPGTRFPRPISNTPDSSPVSTPLQVLFRKPSGSKRSTGSRSGKPASPDVRLPLAPRRFLFRFRFGSVLETRFVRLDYRSVNPGTESIIVKRIAAVKRKIDRFVTLSTAFIELGISMTWRRPPVDSLCINQRLATCFQRCFEAWQLVEISQSGGDSPAARE